MGHTRLLRPHDFGVGGAATRPLKLVRTQAGGPDAGRACARAGAPAAEERQRAGAPDASGHDDVLIIKGAQRAHTHWARAGRPVLVPLLS